MIILQIIAILLLICGIEPNPGPKIIAKPCKDICQVKHKCEVGNCSEDIFASCHCTSCKGLGPLVCFEHFSMDVCPLNHLSSFENSVPFNVQCKHQEIILPNYEFQRIISEKQIECTICYRTFSPEDIKLTMKGYELLLRSDGLFYYVCKFCPEKPTPFSNFLSLLLEENDIPITINVDSSKSNISDRLDTLKLEKFKRKSSKFQMKIMSRRVE